MNTLLRYLGNVHEIRAMEPLTLLQGFKQLDFQSNSNKQLLIAYKKRLKELSSSVNFTQLSKFILNLPPAMDTKFELLDSLVTKLISKSLIGQLNTHKSLISLLKHMKNIGYNNRIFSKYVINNFDQLALSKLDIGLLSELCNCLDHCDQDFAVKLANSFHYLLQSIDLDSCADCTIESITRCLIGLAKFNIDLDMICISNKLLIRLKQFSDPSLSIFLLNSIIKYRDSYDYISHYNQYLNDAITKINFVNLNKEMITKILQLSSNAKDFLNKSIFSKISNSILSNFLTFNATQVIDPLNSCIIIENSELASQIIENMNFGNCNYNEYLKLLDCFYNVKNKFNISISKAGYLIDRINYQLNYKEKVPFRKKLKLGYVNRQLKNPINTAILFQLSCIASLSSQFIEAFTSAQNLTISIINGIKSQNLWDKLTIVDKSNLLFAMSRLRIRDESALDNLKIDTNITDAQLYIKIMKSFALLQYPRVNYLSIISRGKRYIIGKFDDSKNLDLILYLNSTANFIRCDNNKYSNNAGVCENFAADCLELNFLYGFAPGIINCKSGFGVPFRLNKPINKTLWSKPFLWYKLFNGKGSSADKVALNKLETMLVENGYNILKRNVKWKGLINIDLIVCKGNKLGKYRRLSIDFIGVNLLMPSDFYTDGSVIASKRLQLHLLSLDMNTLNIHFEQVLKYRQMK